MIISPQISAITFLTILNPGALRSYEYEFRKYEHVGLLRNVQNSNLMNYINN